MGRRCLALAMLYGGWPIPEIEATLYVRDMRIPTRDWLWAAVFVAVYAAGVYYAGWLWLR